jgi:FtsH-binding integral membrane protein
MTGGIDDGDGQAVLPVRRRSTFFLVASLLMAGTVFLGFLPSFYFRFQFRTTPLPLHLIVHGLIMTAWMLLFVAQTTLVATRRSDLHRRLGVAGAVLAAVVVLVGVFVTLATPGYFAERGVVLPFPIEMLVVANIFGFALFGGFVATAIVLRRDTATHRRLMYWASIVTIGPALTPSRNLGEMILPYFPATFPPEVALGWIAWSALLVHDWRTMRTFHPASVIGGMLLLFISPAVVDYVLVIDAVREWVRSLG